MKFEWYLTATDGKLNCRSGYTYNTEQQAVLHGNRWKKETGRVGVITATPAESEPHNYIWDR